MDNPTAPVAIVTGAGSGIGAAVCRALAAEGHSLVLVGRRLAPLQEVASKLAGPTHIVTCDVREADQVERAIAEAAGKFGRIDVLVNNAGVFRPSPLDECTVADWDDVISSNLRSAFLMSRGCWPHLKESMGQIVNLSSISATMGFPGGAAYCASKYGMNGLNEVLAIEGKPYGIRAFAVCPAQVATPIWEERADKDSLARMMTPDQIAELVRWLVVSPRNLKIAPVVISNFNSPWDS